MAAAPIQRVCVPTFERRDEPRPHMVYAIQVTLPSQTWTVYRRYSEFAALQAALPPPAPPAPLPPKQAAKDSWRAIVGLGGWLPVTAAQQRADDAAAEERRQGLERYLRGIITAPDPHWRESDAFLQFLQVPEHQREPAVATEHPPPPPPPPKGLPAAAAGPLPRPWYSRAPPTARRQETDVTRPMDDHALLRHQTSTLMANQDAQAEQLAQILRRQRELGLTIHDELEVHKELLQSMQTHMQQTQTKLDAAENSMHRLQS
ncbi:Uncharacterized protein MSYG_1260 [Malassezia sympodialis ATCC 42132]|uniref:PX domain-containing protein n=1 Tax=Malassezia sympodialis (strain ATCC 42132) TaxID=1230383 RepID=A0A1M8A3D6_MALS4|nr:Uncharacterized protein MSYG_1260 [Malassezia sympodialis ATCC 42132]